MHRADLHARESSLHTWGPALAHRPRRVRANLRLGAIRCQSESERLHQASELVDADWVGPVVSDVSMQSGL